MEGLFVLLTLASVGCIPLALINPKLFQFLLKSHATRLKGVSFFIGCTILFFILFAVVSSSKSTFQNGGKSASTNVPTSPTDAPTPQPTSTDPCSKYEGEERAFCIRAGAIMKQNETMQNNPLKAKVTFDSSAIYITNTTTTDWKQCNATLDDDSTKDDVFESDGFIVSGGQTATISWGNFANTKNQRFDYFSTKPRSVRLDCHNVNGKEGVSTFSL